MNAPVRHGGQVGRVRNELAEGVSPVRIARATAVFGAGRGNRDREQADEILSQLAALRLLELVVEKIEPSTNRGIQDSEVVRAAVDRQVFPPVPEFVILGPGN